MGNKNLKSGKMSLYVGCALTGAPEHFTDQVEKLKASLRSVGYEVFDFVGLVNGTPEDVYRWDLGHCVKKCDALVAICDFPAIGLGFEMNEAIRLKKPVLALAAKDARVTRLVMGAAEVEPNLAFMKYSDFNKEALGMIKDWLQSLP